METNFVFKKNIKYQSNNYVLEVYPMPGLGCPRYHELILYDNDMHFIKCIHAYKGNLNDSEAIGIYGQILLLTKGNVLDKMIISSWLPRNIIITEHVEKNKYFIPVINNQYELEFHTHRGVYNIDNIHRLRVHDLDYMLDVRQYISNIVFMENGFEIWYDLKENENNEDSTNMVYEDAEQ